MAIRKASPERLGAFSDGVIAVIITIMVLDLKAPHDGSPAALLCFGLGLPVTRSAICSSEWFGSTTTIFSATQRTQTTW